nr:phage GP46 family protein [Nannocystis pusilla]
MRLKWDNSVGRARLQLADDGTLASDGGIETLAILSLFTDAEASPAEITTAGLDRQRGWWAHADSVRPADTPKMGSKLWLLTREKTTLATLRRAEDIALESLVWLKARGIAKSIQVVASRPRAGWLGLEIDIVRPSSLLPSFRRLWEVKHNAF